MSPIQPTRLNNATCPYCAGTLAGAPTTKEHLIGRRFVPRGTLQQEWNLILRACEPCNRPKADLEDDLAAISMQPDAFGRHSRGDAKLATEAARKARGSRSRLTGRSVADSAVAFRVGSSPLPGVRVTFGLRAPPQPDEARVIQLARLQLVGFFYFLTFDPTARVGGYWPGSFFAVDGSARTDWGNALQRGCMALVRDWPPRLVSTTARGFFRVAIRRAPTAIAWSWALEWNENLHHRLLR